MLEKKDWLEAAPEVPQEFHVRFEETVQRLESKKATGKKTRFRILMAAAVICALCTATVAADEVFKWSDALLERLKPNEEQQQKMAESGNIQGVGQSVTKNGVTVTLDQALQDTRSLYLLFTVETPEDIILDNTAGFERGLSITIDGKDIIDALSEDKTIASIGGGGGFVYREEGAPAHKGYYEVNYSLEGKYDFSGRTIGATLEDLSLGGDKALPGTVVAEGKWEFEWKLGEVEKEKRIQINQTYDFGGYNILIKYLDISPLSYTIYADLEDALKVEEDERNTFTYEGDDPGMKIDQRIAVCAVEYQDGTKLENLMGGGGGNSADEKEGVYKVSRGFGNIVDVENLKSIYLMQGELEVPITQ